MDNPWAILGNYSDELFREALLLDDSPDSSWLCSVCGFVTYVELEFTDHMKTLTGTDLKRHVMGRFLVLDQGERYG